MVGNREIPAPDRNAPPNPPGVENFCGITSLRLIARNAPRTVERTAPFSRRLQAARIAYTGSRRTPIDEVRNKIFRARHGGWPNRPPGDSANEMFMKSG
jgi:hypothetical protein